MNQRLLAHIALTAVAFIYAGNYLIAKLVLDPGYVRPFGFILLRVTAAVLVFWLVDWLFMKSRVDRKDLPLMAICGLFGVAVNQLCFFAGLKLTVPINASLLMTTTPILVVISASLLIKERVSALRIAGILTGMAGAVLLITRGFTVGIDISGGSLGDLLIIANASSYAVYLVLVKKLMHKYQPLVVVKWVFSFGLIPVLLLGAGDIPHIAWSEMPTSAYLSIAYVLLLTTVVAYFLNAYSLGVVSPSVTSIYIYLQPLLTTLFSIVFYEQKPDAVVAISGAMIILGVYLAGKKPKVPPQKPPF